MLMQLSILVLCHTALAVPMQPEYDVENSDLVMSLFENFIVKYKRSYDVGEKMQRFQYFKQSLAEINRLNEANPVAVFDINKFCDWSPEELKTLAGLKNEHHLPDSLCRSDPNVTTHEAPASFDWKDKGAVTPVKNQRRCGSCWAFSATGAVESAYAIKHNKMLSLSEQQLMDCDDKSNGCWGGVIQYGLTKLIQEGGQELESDYPYIAQQSHACYFDNTKIAVKVSSCNVYNNIKEDKLKEVLFKNGPLSIGVDAHPLLNYEKGILSNCSFSITNHAVLIVGYGTEDGTDFWHVKNSWGADWGEQGFFRMNRGNNCMGLGQYTVSVTVE